MKMCLTADTVCSEEGDERIELLAESIHSGVEEIPDGKQTQDFVVVVDDGQMTKMTVRHDLERFTHLHVLLGRDTVRGHDFGDGRLFWMLFGQDHADHHSPLGEDARKRVAAP